MHRVARRGRSHRLFAAGVAAVLSHAAGSGVARATPVVFHVFNLGPTVAYSVERNTTHLSIESTTPSGAFFERFDLSTGDRVVLSPNQDLQPPAPTQLISVTVMSPRCVRVQWLPGGDPTVVGYVVSYGVLSVAGGQAKQYQYWVQLGPIASYDVCGLGAALYYFSIQTVNYAGQRSAYSTEFAASTITLPVLISRFDARPEEGGVRLLWRVSADEAVAGYRIYRSGRDGMERPLVEALLAPDEETYLDRDTRGGTRYTYVLAAVKPDGSEVRSAPASVTTPAYALALGPNLPNPFRTSTHIPFVLDAPSRVTLRVYDVRGALVATVFDGVLPEGAHAMDWSGLDDAGGRAASGTYFYALTAGKKLRSRKMQLVR